MSTKKIRETSTFTIIALLIAGTIAAQSSKKVFKFANCNWGTAPEEAINTIKEALAEGLGGIEIIEKSSAEEKEVGIRIFRTNTIKALEIGGQKWDSLELCFIDNKLKQVNLKGGKEVHCYELKNEFRIRYGDADPDLIQMPTSSSFESDSWSGEDGSRLSLSSVESKVMPIKVVILSYSSPAAATEIGKRRDEIIRKKKTIW